MSRKGALGDGEGVRNGEGAGDSSCARLIGRVRPRPCRNCYPGTGHGPDQSGVDEGNALQRRATGPGGYS